MRAPASRRLSGPGLSLSARLPLPLGLPIPRPLALALAGVLTVSVPVRALAAQGTATMEAGTAVLRQGGIPQSTVLTLATQLGWVGARGALAANAIAARTPDARWTGQTLVGGALYAGAPGARWELGGSYGAFGESNETPFSSAQVVVRRHARIAGRADLFAGLGAGATGHGGRWQRAWLGQGGVVAPLGRGVLTAAFAYTDARRELRVAIPPFPDYFEITPVRYGDALAFWERTGGALDVTVGAGARVFGIASNPTPWGSASVAWWMLPRLAIVGSVGRALEDLVRAVPETRYASLAVRIPLASGGRRRTTTDVEAASDERPRLFVERPTGTAAAADAHRRVIGVRVRDARSVELMADFTEWEPLALVARDGIWTAECIVAPGAHRVAVRIDGGAWQVPANLPPIDDDFGGTVGLLTVP